MWLINTATLDLHHFTDEFVAPPYAILSHCWGKQEVNFKDFSNKRKRSGPGHQKIVDCCAYVRDLAWQESLRASASAEPSDVMIPHHGFKWLWADTCCIDKRSSSELSEAINSMFSYYTEARVCVGYLSDVKNSEANAPAQFEQSRWFTRGWTLQELIAAHQIVFVDRKWQDIGVKRKSRLLIGERQESTVLYSTIERITGIPSSVLSHRVRLKGYSVAQRMSWASQRVTTREEDIAYSLFGLFDINMPLLYGEGGITAFRRLQHEILRREFGESLFAWRPTDELPIRREHQLFATSPKHFAGLADVVDIARRTGPIFSSRGHWITLEVPALPQKAILERVGGQVGDTHDEVIVRLACGRLTEQGNDQIFTPCVLHLKSMAYSRHLLRFRELTYNGFFLETDIPHPSQWRPVKGPETKYILMHSGEAEARRWETHIFDSEGLLIKSGIYDGPIRLKRDMRLNAPLIRNVVQGEAWETDVPIRQQTGFANPWLEDQVDSS